jgi:hypothetical protein
MTSSTVTSNNIRTIQSRSKPEAFSGGVRAFLNRLFSPISGASPVVGVRIQNKETGNWHSGYFNDGLSGWTTLGQAILAHDGVNNTHLCFNPLKPTVLDRGRDRIAATTQAYTDDDVLRRWAFVIDLDPRRPKSDTCATAEEKAHARAKAAEVNGWLSARGWPQALIVDSGNGFYLVYRIDLACNKATDALIVNCLTALDQLFTDEHVKIDTTAANRGRLLRFIGTVNVKGQDVPDRPWRRSAIIEGPASFAERSVVDHILLEPLAAIAVQTARDTAAKKSAGWGFEIAKFLADFKIERRGPFDVADGEKWIFELCPFKGEHAHHAGEAFAIRFKTGFVLVRCSHATCAGLDVADMRDAWEGSGWRTHNPDPYKSDAGKATAAGKVVNHVLAHCKPVLFHDPGNVAYATVTVDGHEATYRLDSQAFELWLKAQCLYANLSTASHDLAEVIDSLTAIAQVKGDERRVYLRRGQDETGNCYLDLGTKDWQILALRKDGTCAVIPYAQCGCRFWRSSLVAPLPLPELSADYADAIERLGKHVNCSSDELKIFLTAAIFELILPDEARPIIVFTGKKGSGKSTAMKALKYLVDPMGSGLAACAFPPLKDQPTLVSSANATSLLPFDNQSWISKELSDELCVLSTGGMQGQRTLYKNFELSTFESKHALLFTAINDQLLSEQDALDRGFYIHSLPLEGDEGRAEGETAKIEDTQLERNLSADRSQILGALAALAAIALRDWGAITLTTKSRLTAFQRVGCAVLRTLRAGDFTQIVAANRREGKERSLDGDIVVEGLESLVRYGSFKGTTTELHTAFCSQFPDQATRRRKDFPDTPKKLGMALLKLGDSLKLRGLYCTKGRARNDRVREIGRTDPATYQAAPKQPAQWTDGHGNSRNGDIPF